MPDPIIAIRDQILTSALVTAVADDRVYPQVAPQHAPYPYVTLTLVGTDRTPSVNLGQSNPVRATFQVDAFAKTYEGVAVLSEGIRRALDGQSGDLGPEPLDVREMWLEGPSDAPTTPQDGSEAPVFRRTFGGTIWFRETPPDSIGA